MRTMPALGQGTRIDDRRCKTSYARSAFAPEITLAVPPSAHDCRTLVSSSCPLHFEFEARKLASPRVERTGLQVSKIPLSHCATVSQFGTCRDQRSEMARAADCTSALLEPMPIR